MGRKQNFEISLSLLPLLSLFLPSFCFFCKAFTRIRFGRKCRFRILGLDLDGSIGGRRNKIFMHEEFSANVICCLFVFFFLPFSPTSKTESCSFWYSLPRRRFYGSSYFFPPHKEEIRAPLKTPAWEANSGMV